MQWRTPTAAVAGFSRLWLFDLRLSLSAAALSLILTFSTSCRDVAIPFFDFFWKGV
jgi:hypothetical protein